MRTAASIRPIQPQTCRVLELNAAGHRNTEIAAIVGISVDAVGHALRYHGRKPANGRGGLFHRRKRPESRGGIGVGIDDTAKAYRMYALDASVSQVMYELGCTEGQAERLKEDCPPDWITLR